MICFPMTVDGAALPAQAVFDVLDPATEEVFAQAPACTPAQLDLAFEAAARAAGAWAADPAARRDLLRAAAGAVSAARDELAVLLATEQGKPVRAAAFEVDQHALWLRESAALPLAEEILQDDGTAVAALVRRPLGVVAAITPWNYPILLAGWKLGPALVAGNTVVLKPSPYTPVATLRLGELLAGVLPPGVVNVISGPDPLGAAMTAHPAVAKISFTGSVRTGVAVARAAAAGMKRLTLELGGNDAAIVLDDVAPEAIAKSLFWAAFTNCGQICAGIKRLYVPERLHDPLVEALVAVASRARVGPATDERSRIGPLNNRTQFERVAALVEEAVTAGARVAVGGLAPARPGYFYAPTVLTGAREGMRVVDEEQFGPVLPVLTYREVDEAVARANAGPFGLSGSVWGGDAARAESVARRLECGTAFVNDHLTVAPHLPFGGWKMSGLGVENGPWGLDQFTQPQVVYRRRG
ncbi:aldehyde dehydrogenase family protein [Nonomuraea purpurea]|uniref:Aldehyde dehydrogenase family protein n=1 Tax=Nonomuraea purpurea TaxID=1849276 RepID=A0ABV8G1I6_9ACTN